MADEITVDSDGQIVVIDSKGEITPVKDEDLFGAVLKQQGVMGSTQVRASYDMQTEEGKAMLGRHMNSTEGKDVKANWLNKQFSLVGYTAKVVRALKDVDGNRMPEPKLLIRTIMETLEGDLIPSSSAYVYESLEIIRMAHPNLSIAHPVMVEIYKAGQADKVKDVEASKRRVLTSAAPTKGKASK